VHSLASTSIDTLNHHSFNGLLSRTTSVSRHQKGKSFGIFVNREMTETAATSAGAYTSHPALINTFTTAGFGSVQTVLLPNRD